MKDREGYENTKRNWESWKKIMREDQEKIQANKFFIRVWKIFLNHQQKKTVKEKTKAILTGI